LVEGLTLPELFSSDLNLLDGSTFWAGCSLSGIVAGGVDDVSCRDDEYRQFWFATKYARLYFLRF
jgi:hypothetical protein